MPGGRWGAKAFSSEVDTGSRKENALDKKERFQAKALIPRLNPISARSRNR
jgi:hypothetical protein